MTKPTSAQFQQALQVAEHMREQNTDAQHLAKSLQYLHRRVTQLEEVLQHADLYLHSGLAEQEHARLVRAIEAAKRAERKESERDSEDFGVL